MVHVSHIPRPNFKVRKGSQSRTGSDKTAMVCVCWNVGDMQCY